MRLDHVGIAVENIQAALKVYCDSLGFELKEIVDLPEEGVKIARITSRDLEVELIQPLGEETPVGRFLKKRGGGIHHLCFSVPQMEQTLGELKERGLRPISAPRPGVAGKRIAFFHPKDTLGALIEISEEKEG